MFRYPDMATSLSTSTSHLTNYHVLLMYSDVINIMFISRQNARARPINEVCYICSILACSPGGDIERICSRPANNISRYHQKLLNTKTLAEGLDSPYCPIVYAVAKQAYLE